MEHSRFLSGLILAIFLSQALVNSETKNSNIKVTEIEGNVHLECLNNITWQEGTEPLPNGKTSKRIDLGKLILDPRGMYECEVGKKTTMQIYYRMCQNCVELDTTTVTGIIVTDIITTLLLALGVYCFAGHETGRPSEAADTQVLMRNDELYQPLRERSNDQYSSLGENWQRKK